MPRCNALGLVGADEEAAPRRRLKTLAQKEARRGGGSSRGGGDDDDKAFPNNFQRTPSGFAYVAPTDEAQDDDADDEDPGPLVRRRARVRSDVGAASAEAEVGAASVEAEREQPLPAAPASPVRAAPACPTRGLALKRKTWGSASDDEE